VADSPLDAAKNLFASLEARFFVDAASLTLLWMDGFDPASRVEGAAGATTFFLTLDSSR
jgi:hypothetical protein